MEYLLLYAYGVYGKLLGLNIAILSISSLVVFILGCLFFSSLGDSDDDIEWHIKFTRYLKLVGLYIFIPCMLLKTFLPSELFIKQAVAIYVGKSLYQTEFVQETGKIVADKLPLVLQKIMDEYLKDIKTETSKE